MESNFGEGESISEMDFFVFASDAPEAP